MSSLGTLALLAFWEDGDGNGWVSKARDGGLGMDGLNLALAPTSLDPFPVLNPSRFEVSKSLGRATMRTQLNIEAEQSEIRPGAVGKELAVHWASEGSLRRRHGPGRRRKWSLSSLIG